MRNGHPPARSVVTSVVFHVLLLVLLLLLPVKAPRSARPQEVDVVFYRPRPQIELPVLAAPALRPPGDATAIRLGPERAASPAPPVIPQEPRPPEDPLGSGTPELAPGPQSEPMAQAPPRREVGKTGILAYRDRLASLSRDQPALRLGEDARYRAADDEGQASAPSQLTTHAPGSSGGIDLASLSRSVGGGGGGGALYGDGGVPVGRATSPLAGIGGGGAGGGSGRGSGGGDPGGAHGGPGASRTDEEIQIVFDRHKASFYRLYNRELRNDPTLQGQMVLRLTIEPDGSVSMCVLQSSDMNAPELAAQVVDRVLAIDFGAKEGVQALTIVYPIDFLPAA